MAVVVACAIWHGLPFGIDARLGMSYATGLGSNCLRSCLPDFACLNCLVFIPRKRFGRCRPSEIDELRGLLARSLARTDAPPGRPARLFASLP
jgi:hypothetical protein